jgi:hypothetical protein
MQSKGGGLKDKDKDVLLVQSSEWVVREWKSHRG